MAKPKVGFTGFYLILIKNEPPQNGTWHLNGTRRPQSRCTRHARAGGGTAHRPPRTVRAAVGRELRGERVF